MTSGALSDGSIILSSSDTINRNQKSLLSQKKKKKKNAHEMKCDGRFTYKKQLKKTINNIYTFLFLTA